MTSNTPNARAWWMTPRTYTYTVTWGNGRKVVVVAQNDESAARKAGDYHYVADRDASRDDERGYCFRMTVPGSTRIRFCYVYA